MGSCVAGLRRMYARGINMAEKIFEQLKRCITIDKHDLDGEIVQFPEIFYKVCEQVQIAETHLNDARLSRQDVETQLSGKARERLGTKGGRVTNASVETWVRGRMSYKNVDAQYQLAKDELGQWQALKETMQIKSYKLRDLVDLYIAQYYSDPSSNDGSTEKRRRAIRSATKKHG